MWLLQESLAEICGLPHVSLQPSAGSHGELAGLLLTRAYHADRGEARTKVLTPDTAHGTNPASVTMAGYEVVKVATNERGGVDMDDLRAKIDGPDQVACLMLTNPNTLGLFDENIAEIAGADPRGGRDALLRRRQPERDHGPVAARATWASTSSTSTSTSPSASRTAAAARAPARSPSPTGSSRSCRARRWSGARATTAAARSFDLDFDRPKSIGRLRGFQGNFGVFVRSYAYILSLGADGLAEASETAVLNANYLKARLAAGPRRRAPAGRLRPPLHARVRPLRQADEDGARPRDPRPRQAPARLRLPPADRLLPAAGRRGADGRADRDRDEGDPRRLRRRDRADPRGGREPIPRSPRTPPTRPRCGASTRSERPGGRLCGARCSQPGGRPSG